MDMNHTHRQTLERIFGHPLSSNVEWRQVRSLLESVGAATEEQNGKLKVTLGDETAVLEPPPGKDVDRRTLVDLRRMLEREGVTP